MIHTRVLPAALLATVLGGIALAPAACAAAPTGGTTAPADETPGSTTQLPPELDTTHSLIEKIAGTHEGDASTSQQPGKDQWNNATEELPHVITHTTQAL
ncbi:hypothetical protein [Streptomyces sp. NPDC058657]|uniref:hypothetical protein n=1 Tax=unclassified Streptomyces TaxID=2593676 RepID=UPI0036515D53